MLTESQRESIRSGEIRDKDMMKIRIRDNLADAIRDVNLVLQHHTWIEGEAGIEAEFDDSDVANLVGNMLYLVDNEHVDDNLLWLLLESAETAWTVPGAENVHGKREELALDIFIECFEDYDPEDSMVPEPEKLENWDQFQEVLDQINR